MNSVDMNISRFESRIEDTVPAKKSVLFCTTHNLNIQVKNNILRTVARNVKRGGHVAFVIPSFGPVLYKVTRMLQKMVPFRGCQTMGVPNLPITNYGGCRVGQNPTMRGAELVDFENHGVPSEQKKIGRRTRPKNFLAI